MKKFILVLVAIIGLVGTASAKTTYAGKTNSGNDKYTIENNRIGKITYSVGKAEAQITYDIMGEPDEGGLNLGLDPEVAELTKKFGYTSAACKDAFGCYIILNVYKDGNFYSFIWN